MKYLLCFLILASKNVTAQTANDWLNQGIAKKSTNNFEGAIEDFNTALKITPDLAQALRGRAMCYKKLGKNKEALADYNQVIQIDPKNKEMINDRGGLKNTTGDYKGAVEDFTFIIKEIDSLYKYAYNNRGWAYMQLHKYTEAMHDLNEAIHIDQKSRLSYMNRGLLMIRLKAYDNAINDFDMVTVYEPKNKYAYGNRGYAKYKLNRYSDAFEDLSRSLDIDPNYAYAFNIRAYTNYYLQKYEDAFTDVNKAIKLQPKYASYYDSRGEIYYLTNKPKQALKDFSKAIELNPQFKHAYIYRCLVNLQLNNIEEAKEDYKKIMEIIPKYNNDTEVKGYELLKQKIDQLGIQPTNFENSPHDSAYSSIVRLWFKPVIVKDTTSSTSKIYTFVDTPAEPEGGLEAFYKFIAKNLRYPENAIRLRQEGKVFIKFIIEKSGDISNVLIVKGLSDELNQEAVRVISISPKWKPGMQDGTAVRQSYTLPIAFSLQGFVKH